MASEPSEALLPYTAPIFTIDLSLKPRDRYKALAQAYKNQVHHLTPLFNNLLQDLGLPVSYHGLINGAARLLLRGVHSRVETAELQGISDVTGISMYLLVALNVVLDLLMGCTSGAVKSLEAGKPMGEARMLHFRTLDWSMDPLRDVIVHLEFVRSKSATPTAVLARSITYVGFVGVLTGVRPGLSLSLNFRPIHNASNRQEHFRFYFHHLLVLLGYRASISSLLRQYIIPEVSRTSHSPKSLAQISEELTPRHTTAAYLTFSDGNSTIILEKDFSDAVIRQSNSFIAATNHDNGHESLVKGQPTSPTQELTAGNFRAAAGLEEMLEESKDRLTCVTRKWKSRVQKSERRSRLKGDMERNHSEANVTITEAEAIHWVSDFPTTNEQTHFAALMDPTAGQIVWNLVYPFNSGPPGSSSG